MAAVLDPEAERKRAEGAFVRGVSGVRGRVGTAEFPAEAGRYHLYVGFNCPWCHRVVLSRAILGLTEAISMDVCFPTRSLTKDAQGRDGLWCFKPDGVETPNGRFTTFPECTADTVFGKETVVEIYEAGGFLADKSVPLLVDKKTGRIVNNESSEILRMFTDHAADLGATRPLDLYPAGLRAAVDATNEWIYHDVNNGSYKAGFATSQAHYEAAYLTYFAALDRLEKILAEQRFVAGDQVTEADLRLFPTLFRHDPVYHTRFKLNQAFLRGGYAHIWAWLHRMYDVPGLAEAADASYLDHCKQGYFGRTGANTIPLGPPGYPECYWT